MGSMNQAHRGIRCLATGFGKPEFPFRLPRTFPWNYSVFKLMARSCPQSGSYSLVNLGGSPEVFPSNEEARQATSANAGAAHRHGPSVTMGKNMLRLSLLALICMLSVGCTTYVRHGAYETAPIDGWKLVQREGTYSFLSVRFPDGGVVGSSPKKGELYMHVYVPGRLVRFETGTVRVIPHDGGPIMTFSPSESMAISVTGTSDFTIELPSFTVDSEPMPRFAARFRWSDKTYRVIRPLQ
jgi:hypothetical protein